ncbi:MULTISPECIES: BLUF domain-containing protein [unclassified Acidovorax]|uniref:BLUF domain-containing protein n=1 Tax=unclassified Acidovorax TaxID=2684926 RepID=UPI0028834275|nr:MULTISPECIES: BLUF domain-containing protein [unclassified Acidovorax]
MRAVCYFGPARRNGNLAVPPESLLAACAEYAHRSGLTGLLAVAEGYFLHFLEGDDAAVRGLLARTTAYWNHEAPTVLFTQRINERTYDQWSVALVQSSSAAASDTSERLATIRGFLTSQRLAAVTDAFRYFLTPNRAPRPAAAQAGHSGTGGSGGSGAVKQVAVFSNSVLWFHPIFSHLADRFGTQACSLKISDTGRNADTFPLDYADVASDATGAVRLVGISESLLGSTLASPLLRNVDLVVFLMRRSGHGSDTEFVTRALAHPMVRQAHPEVLFITPPGRTELSAALRELAQAVGFASTETAGSVLAGGPIWAAMQARLSVMQPRPVVRRGVALDIDLSEPWPPVTAR